ncbi:hypothetical protein ES703_93764 [subsurface metagenome]
MLNNIDKVKNLDNKITELGKELLYRMKCFLDIYKIISLNAIEINAIGREKIFFGQLQRMSLESYVLDICKVFEKEKNYELNSLPSILKTAKDCKPQDEQPLRDFVNEYRDLLSQREECCSNSLIAELEQIYTKFYQKYFEQDDRIEKVRNKIIAHSEDIANDVRSRGLPSYDFLEKLLFFALDMHSAISKAYLQVFPHPIKNDRKVFSSTCTVLEKLGVSNVKTKFDDD